MPYSKASAKSIPGKKLSPKTVKRQSRTSKKDDTESDEDFSSDEEIVVPKAKPMIVKKPVVKKKIIVESDDEDDESEEDEGVIKKPQAPYAKKLSDNSISKTLKKAPAKKSGVKVEKNDKVNIPNKDLPDSKLFVDKSSLQNETNLDTIIQFIDADYKFSQKDFDNFIKYACAEKDNFITYKYYNEKKKYYYNYSENKYRKKIVPYMFKNFFPNEQQFNKICYGYGANKLRYSSDDLAYEWIDTIYKNGFQFSTAQKDMLVKINYPDLVKVCNIELSEVQIKSIIDKLGNNYCNCRGYYNKKVCREYLDSYIDVIDENKSNYPQKYLELYISELKKRNILNNSCEKLLKFYKSLVNKTDLDNSIYTFIEENKIEKINWFDNLLFMIKPTNEQLIYLAENEYLNSMNTIIKLIKNGINFTTNIINSILKSTYEINYTFDDDLNDDENLKVIGLTFNSLKSENYTDYDDDQYKFKNDHKKGDSINSKKIPTFVLFKYLKLNPDQDTLRIACLERYYTLYKKLTKEYKLVPDKECLDNSIEKQSDGTLNKEMIRDILCYKILPDDDSLKKLLVKEFHNHYYKSKNDSIQLQVIELFIKNGLQITLDNFELITKKHITIPDLNKFGIEYDEKLYYLCFKYDYFPTEYLDKMKIDKSILDLRDMCRRKKITVNTFKEYLTKKKVKPDRYCLDFVIRLNNTYLIEYMFKKLDCQPTLNSFYLRGYVPRKKFWGLLEKYNFDWHEMAQPFDHIDLDNLP